MESHGRCAGQSLKLERGTTSTLRAQSSEDVAAEREARSVKQDSLQVGGASRTTRTHRVLCDVSMQGKRKHGGRVRRGTLAAPIPGCSCSVVGPTTMPTRTSGESWVQYIIRTSVNSLLLVWCGNIVSSGVHGPVHRATRRPREQCGPGGVRPPPPGHSSYVTAAERTRHSTRTPPCSRRLSCDAARPHTWIPATVTHEFLIDSNARYVACSSSGRPRPHMPHASVM